MGLQDVVLGVQGARGDVGAFGGDPVCSISGLSFEKRSWAFIVGSCL